MHGATFTSSKPRRVHHRPKKCAPFVFELVRAANTVYKKLKSLTESIWLIYPKATFLTLSVSGELQASWLPCTPWLKIPRQNLTFKNILKIHSFQPFSITYRQWGQSPRLSVLPIVSSSRHKTNVFVQFKETI